MIDTTPITTERPSTPATIDVGQLRQAIELALRLGDADVARRVACALLSSCPDAIAPVVLLGHALLESGSLEAATQQFQRALKRNPLDAVAWAGLAGELARSNQATEAAGALQRAALHDPLGSEALAPGIAQAPPSLGLGVIYLRRGHADLAAAELAVTLNRHPEREDLRLYYIEALRRSGDLEEARRQLATFELEDEPSLPVLLLRCALAVSTVDTAAMRKLCWQYDPDGRQARLFFAPERPPWTLPAAPILNWSTEFDPIAAYFPMLLRFGSTRKSVVGDTLVAAQEMLVEEIDQAVNQETAPQTIDPAISELITTTERLRRRLSDLGGSPAPLVSWRRQNLTQVVLSCKLALIRRYGEAGFAMIAQRLDTLVGLLKRRGIHAHCCYIDDAASLRLNDQIALPPVPQDALTIRELVRGLAGAFQQQHRELGVLLLIGGDDIIPFHRLPNPLHDGDASVLSDNPYASDDAGHLIPQRIVARIPEGAGEDPSFLLAILDRMADYHSGRVVVGHSNPLLAPLLGLRRADRQTPTTIPAIGYSAEIWRESSRTVLDALELDAPLHCSPPLDDSSLDAQMLHGKNLFYFNLHGADGSPNWYGQPDVLWPGPATKLPVALRPDHFADRVLKGTLMVSEACYGMDLAGRTAQNSIPLRMLAEGGLACIGATVNAYGSVAAPLIGADLLCQRLLSHLQQGQPIGEALHHARMEFAQTMYRRQGYLDDVDVKTLTEFVLLGDPWASLAASVAPPSSWPVSKLASIERVPKPRPKIVLTEEQVPRDIVRSAREVLKRLIPGATAAPLYITAQPNPRRMRKGDTEQELVFSAQEEQLTADGYCVAQTAHITINGHAVIKVSLTR